MKRDAELIQYVIPFSLQSRYLAKFTKAFLEQTISTTGKGYCYHADVMAYALMYGERKSLNEKNK